MYPSPSWGLGCRFEIQHQGYVALLLRSPSTAFGYISLLGASEAEQGALELSKEIGITQPTLSRWLRTASSLSDMQDGKSKGKKRTWSAEEKLRVLGDATRLTDEELGAFLRSEGVHEATLLEWQAAATSALGSVPTKRRNKKTPEAKKIVQLERELVRKEKALAELAALITLQKKVREIWGDGGDDMNTRSGT